MIGFVYILVNEHFSMGVYKVGCTERSPHERANELSKSTGVPAPFQVLCYVEMDNFQQAERDLHKWLSSFRISANREFFSGGLEHAVGWMWWHKERLSFCPLTDNEPYGESMLHSADFGDYFEGRTADFYALPNPWKASPEFPPDDEDADATPTGFSSNLPVDMPWESVAAADTTAVVEGGSEL